jgi:hypothetical protein
MRNPPLPPAVHAGLPVICASKPRFEKIKRFSPNFLEEPKTALFLAM